MKFMLKALAVLLISSFILGCSTAQQTVPSAEPAEKIDEKRRKVDRPGKADQTSKASRTGKEDRSSNADQPGYVEKGRATFYANRHQSRKTANGEIYHHQRYTAAHRTLPFGTKVRVTNIKNGKSVVVTINDRGPFIKGRILDLSRSAFNRIASMSSGVIEVKMEVVE